MNVEFKQVLPNPQATDEAAARLADCLTPGLVITLEGPVGAGKTSFVRALLRALHITGPVKSPTYTLVEPYASSKLYLYHFDLYRFFDPEEWEAAGFRDLFDGVNVHLIEWPEKAAGLLPPVDVVLQLNYQDEGRILAARGSSVSGEQCLSRWMAVTNPSTTAGNG